MFKTKNTLIVTKKNSNLARFANVTKKKKKKKHGTGGTEAISKESLEGSDFSSLINNEEKQKFSAVEFVNKLVLLL